MSSCDKCGGDAEHSILAREATYYEPEEWVDLCAQCMEAIDEQRERYEDAKEEAKWEREYERRTRDEG